MLNGLWLGFFLVAAASALARWLIGGDATVFAAMVESLFAMAKLAVEVMVLLFGTLTLWLGFLRIAEKAGLVERLAVLLGPLFRRLMPEVPPGHPAIGLITLNFAANGLGLDNAATPIGLKAMKALQELNPSSTTASNAQILFLVLNASSLTLLPVTIFMYRAQQGAADPTLVFLPILLATSASTLAGLLSVALMQRLRLWDPVVLGYLIPGALLLAGFMAVLGTLSATALAQLSSLLGNLTLFSLIVLFLIVGALKKVPVYESFVEGEGRFRRCQEPVALPGRDALRGWRAARLRGAGSGTRRDTLGGRGLGWDSRFVERCPPRWSSRSPAARRGRCCWRPCRPTASTVSRRWSPPPCRAVPRPPSTCSPSISARSACSARHAVGCALTADLAGVIASIGVCYWFFA